MLNKVIREFKKDMSLKKYIQERFPEYFLFGYTDRGVNISDGNDDICIISQADDANKIMKDRKEAIEIIEKLALKLNEVSSKEFDKIWYRE